MNLIKMLMYCLVAFYGIELACCTGILLKTQNGECVYGRTMEYNLPLQSDILCIPRDYTFVGIAPSGKEEGILWRSTYAACGMSAYHLNVLVDGVNEKGLAGGLFYFPGFAEYTRVTADDYQKSLPMWHVLTWLLTTCATIDEVKRVLAEILISDVPLPGTQHTPPLHMIMHDRSGKSIVVEYMNGGTVHIHDNSLGVMTNAPSFEWHMTNLRNYVHLSPYDTKSTTIGDVRCAPLGNGSGMLGLPGDFTSPSRFVRAVALTQSMPLFDSTAKAVEQAFHILNSFDIPYGCVVDSQKRVAVTEWTIAIELTDPTLHFHTYTNRTVRSIHLDTVADVQSLVRIALQ